LEIIKEIIDLIEISIKPNHDKQINSWNIIKDWYDKRVDEYRDILSKWNSFIISYQSEISKKYSISWLKIKYTNLSWYFIEVLKSQLDKVPDNFILRQSLVNCSRYTSSELIEFEKSYIQALSNLADLEYEIYNSIWDKILNYFDEIKIVSDKIAYLDFAVWLADLAYENDYIKPEMSLDYDLLIESWRHAIIEKSISNFITNDLELKKDSFVHIITWANMGWKSTFLRQNALIIYLAHIWSFVPAKRAIIPIVDKIFSRVGAQDNIFLWQSTFMVEMQEVANIMNNSTSKSFVIIDEIWRWTSAYDWLSIAWAILKENHDKIKAKTLFSTHYHELIDKSIVLEWVKNFSMAVSVHNWELVFLRKLISGWIKKSYWLELAKLAWINNRLIEEARKFLKILEQENDKWDKTLLSSNKQDLDNDCLDKIDNNSIEIINILKHLDINYLSPISALNILSDIKDKLSKLEN